GHIPFELGTATAVRDLQVPDGKVRGAQRRSDSAKPVSGLRLVEDEIAAEDEIEITHFGWPLIVYELLDAIVRNHAIQHAPRRASRQSRPQGQTPAWR